LIKDQREFAAIVEMDDEGQGWIRMVQHATTEDEKFQKEQLAALYTEQALPYIGKEDPEAVALFQEFLRLTDPKKDQYGSFVVQTVPEPEIPGATECEKLARSFRRESKPKRHTMQGRLVLLGGVKRAVAEFEIKLFI
jgi:hypothetical protein